MAKGRAYVYVEYAWNPEEDKQQPGRILAEGKFDCDGILLGA